MPTLGPWELIVILIIVIVIFGAGRLSEVGGALGKSIREFRKATSDEPHPVAPMAAPAAAPPPVFTAPAAAPPAVPTPPGAVGVVSQNTCPSCATPNPAGQTFCGQCGTRLIRAA